MRSTDAAEINNPASSCTEGYLETAAASTYVIDEEAAAAIDTPNVAQATILKQSLALDTCYRPASIEAGANHYVDGDGVSRRWDHRRHGQSDREAKDQCV
ncbi:hypothetical protein QBK99_06975 [Corticibacterium sp. UT-5YL-CI-8]|nr:hypothetical protein [Tianweitania sp. UT-5YL-CI-8]